MAEQHGCFVPEQVQRFGDANSARLAYILWRSTGLSYDNGRLSAMSVWWHEGQLKARMTYVDIFTGKYCVRDLT